MHSPFNQAMNHTEMCTSRCMRQQVRESSFLLLAHTHRFGRTKSLGGFQMSAQSEKCKDHTPPTHSRSFTSCTCTSYDFSHFGTFILNSSNNFFTLVPLRLEASELHKISPDTGNNFELINVTLLQIDARNLLLRVFRSFHFIVLSKIP